MRPHLLSCIAIEACGCLLCRVHAGGLASKHCGAAVHGCPSTGTEAKARTSFHEHEVGSCRLRYELPWMLDAMLRCSTCSAGSEVGAETCGVAACCAVHDVAARAVSACGRRPRAHAQLRGPAAGGSSGARRRRPACPPRGPSWRRGALCDASSATPPTCASSPGFLHGSGGAGRRRRCSTRIAMASCTLGVKPGHVLARAL